ncbi:hypothetical protein DOY81_006636, partial [Sarcophaga bullata]
YDQQLSYQEDHDFEIFVVIVMCLCGAFSRRIVRENPSISVSDEQFNNIARNMNSSVNPCDDFYGYACGNYSKNHPDVNYQEITSFMDYQYNHQILNLMDTLYQQDQQVTDRRQSFVEKTRIYLKSCRTTTERDIKKYLDEIKPAMRLNWPIWQPQQWQSNAEADKLFDVWSLVGRIHSYGMNNVLINQEILVEADGTFSIMLEPPHPDDGTTLPNTMMIRILLRNLGIGRNTEKILQNLLQLNEDLLRILTLTADSKESVMLTYDQLDYAYPRLNLKLYFQELFHKELPASTLILIRKPKYLQQLNDNMWQTFQRRTMCSYLMLKFLEYLTRDSVSELTDLACIKELRNKMDVSVNYLYETHILSKSIGHIKKDIGKLQLDILHQYDKIFNENHLQLSPQQLQLLRQKLHAVTLNIGNLPLNSSNIMIEDYYANVPPLDKNNYFKNHLSLLRHRFEKSLLYTANQTHYIVAHNNEGSNSGARYITKQNMIILPFGSLQKPLYHFDYHPLFKFSLLGFILAHEYAHAFDTFSLNFNGDGKQSHDIAALLRESSFQNSLQCLQTQLSTDSIDERLADIVASRVAYNLLKFQPKMGEFICPPQNICDISQQYFHEKQFYLNMAQFFCEAFSCPLGSKMNPHMKCRVY